MDLYESTLVLWGLSLGLLGVDFMFFETIWASGSRWWVSGNRFWCFSLGVTFLSLGFDFKTLGIVLIPPGVDFVPRFFCIGGLILGPWESSFCF